MKRFFYTDPIAAAWMEKRHGFIFGNGDSLRSACEAVDPDGKDCPAMLFVIHPDSLHLLEPMPGDIVRLDKRMVECLERSEGGKWRKVWRCVNAYSEFLRCNNWFAPHVLEIVQRDGKAFIWPESVGDAL